MTDYIKEILESVERLLKVLAWISLCFVLAVGLLTYFVFKEPYELESIGVDYTLMKYEKQECESTLPRGQECILVYTYIPPQERLIENENSN